MSPNGRLYLIPVPLSEREPLQAIPEYNLQVVRRLKSFICENAKAARRHLKAFGYPSIHEARMFELNTHTTEEAFAEMLTLLKSVGELGLLSDAGCPGIADPGAEVVRRAHQQGIEVVPLTGPSSIVLSIMSSGFNGQFFAFNGYLPIDKAIRQKKLKELEQLSIKTGQAQYFIETPYRNNELFRLALSMLQPETLLFIGLDIHGAQQFLKSHSVREWKKEQVPDLHKRNVVFGLCRA